MQNFKENTFVVEVILVVYFGGSCLHI